MSGDAPKAQPKKPLGKVLLRRGVIAVALILLMLIPSFIAMGISGQPCATYMAMGTLIGLVAVFAGGLRIGVLVSFVTALLAPIVIVAGLTPITGAAVMALMTLMIGRLSRFGLHRSAVLVPVMLAWPMFSPVPWLPHDRIEQLNDLLVRKGSSLASALDAIHPSQSGSSGSGSSGVTTHLMTELRMDSTYLTWIAVYFLLGALIPVAIAVVARKRLPAPKLVTHAMGESMAYTVTITVLTSVAAYYFLSNPSMPGGAFLIAAILILTQVGTEIAWKLTLQRVLGTLGGVVIFLLLSQWAGQTTYVEFLGLPFPLQMYVIGSIFGVIAVMAKFSPRAWIYFALIVPTTALLNAFTVGQARDLGKARLVDNVIGALLVLLAALITLGYGRVSSRLRSGTVAS